jgi:hypothetical protein
MRFLRSRGSTQVAAKVLGVNQSVAQRRIAEGAERVGQSAASGLGRYGRVSEVGLTAGQSGRCYRSPSNQDAAHEIRGPGSTAP